MKEFAGVNLRQNTALDDLAVLHRTIDVDGVKVFYREAGPKDAPVVLLPHGYPCSSCEFRNLMPLLADRWRLIAQISQGAATSWTSRSYSKLSTAALPRLDGIGFATIQGIHC